MTDQSKQPSQEEAPDPQRQPMKVWHGQKIMDRVTATHRTATETQAAAQSILEILTPNEDEPSPILEAVQGLALTLRHQQATLDTMEKALRSIDERLGRLEKRPR